jgi:GT2 family glycosyltransferase
MPTIAIVITCFNHSEYSRRALESLRCTSTHIDGYDVTLAAFDDCSTDDTESVVRSAGGENIVYWCSDGNRGVTHLWNEAYRRFSKYDYIAIANNDVIFAPEWCGRVLNAMTKHRCGMAGPITNGPGHVPAQDVRRVFPDYEPSDEWPALLRLSDALREQQAFEVQRINGFCMVFETTVLRIAQQDRAGEPFDPRNRNFGNEDELQARLDLRPLVVPSSFVFHYKRVTFRDSRPRAFIRYRRPDANTAELE